MGIFNFLKEMFEDASRGVGGGDGPDAEKFNMEKAWKRIQNDRSPDIFNSLVGDDLPILAMGTPVYCKLDFILEHSGIALGDKIVHLDGDGVVVYTSPREFIERHNGSNPAVNVYYAAVGKNKPLANAAAAKRAKLMIGQKVNYNPALKNCHGFTIGCLTGDFEKSLTLDIKQVDTVIDQLTKKTWQWRCWDGWRGN